MSYNILNLIKNHLVEGTDQLMLCGTFDKNKYVLTSVQEFAENEVNNRWYIYNVVHDVDKITKNYTYLKHICDDEERIPIYDEDFLLLPCSTIILERNQIDGSLE